MNKTIVLQKRPFGPLKADNFKILDDRTPKLEAGKLLLRSMFFSVDPYMRNRMNAIRSYVDPFKVGEPIEGDAIAEVMDSDHPDFRPGDRVTGSFPWKEMMCIDPARATKINDTGISPTAYLGILGLTGLTAYFGLTDVGKIRPGEQVVISGAAGAVGSVAGQIARIMGCQVTGIAGSEQKIQYITDELKFDRAINYKSFPNIRKALAKTNPDGIDIYFDNVGGDVSDSVMYFLNPHARIVLCGQIAL